MNDRLSSRARPSRSVVLPVRWMIRQDLQLFGARTRRHVARQRSQRQRSEAERSAEPQNRSQAARSQTTRSQADNSQSRRAQPEKARSDPSQPDRSQSDRSPTDRADAGKRRSGRRKPAAADGDRTPAAAQGVADIDAPDEGADDAPRPGARLSDKALALIAGGSFFAFLVTVFGVPSPWLTYFQAMILGVVEGVTEFLPVSSTGHLLVVERLMGLGEPPIKQATDTYTIAIQVGAILAVVGIYRRRIVSMIKGIFGFDPQGRALLLRLIVAFIPAAVVGLVLSDTIKTYLFGVWPVVAAWAIGGVFLLVWKPKPGRVTIDEITYRQALIIGSAQVLALWPGTSRSLATIVAALAVGLAMSAAVEFSFLLGLATLSAATLYDLSSNGRELYDKFGLFTPLLGIIVAWITAVIAVKWFVAYLRTHPLKIFGWYRLGIAAVTAGLVLAGVI